METFNPKVPFCIENVGDTPVEIGIYNQSNSSHATRSDCKISYDLKTWQNYNLIAKSSISSDDITDKLLLKNKGDRIYIKADNYVYKENKMGCTRIIVLNAQPDGKIRARGNIASLNHGNNDKYRTNYTKLDSTEECCFDYLFDRCECLIQAPDLVFTSLVRCCYRSMFNGCTSLTQAPELPATTLAEGCYSYMFSGCNKLNYIKCLATDISATNCTTDWLGDVSKTGDFYCLSKAEWSSDENGIPVGWVRHDIE